MDQNSNSRLGARFELGIVGNFLSVLCYAIALSVALGGLILFVELMIQAGILTTFVALPFWFVTWKLVRLGRRFRTRNVESLLQEDPRAPVLYLRSFESDQRVVLTKIPTTRLPVLGNIELSSMPGAAFRFLRWRFMRVQRVEEQNARVLKHLGPVITVAKQGERLPQLGAARIPFKSGPWQVTIQSMMEKSQLIVFQSGRSESLSWELNHAFGLKQFKPVLICAPLAYEGALLTRQEQYGLFKRTMSAEAPESARLLPEQLGDTTYFFFPTPNHLDEFQTEGPPGAVLDQVRPGTSNEIQAHFKRMLKVYWISFAVVVFFIAVRYAIYGYELFSEP
jgi:hypothetical protein